MKFAWIFLILILSGCSSIEKKFVKNELGEEIKREVKSSKEAEVSYSIEVTKKPTEGDEFLEAQVIKTSKTETEFLGTYNLTEVQEHHHKCSPSIYYSDKCEFSTLSFVAMHVAIVGFFFDIFGGEHTYVEQVTVPQEKKTMTKLRTEVADSGKRELVNSGEASFVYGDNFNKIVRAPVKNGVVKFPVSSYIDHVFSNQGGEAKIIYAGESISLTNFVPDDVINNRQAKFDEKQAAYESSPKYAFDQFCSSYQTFKETHEASKSVARSLASHGLKSDNQGFYTVMDMANARMNHWKEQYKDKTGKVLDHKQCEN